MTSENELLPLPKGSCASDMCWDAEVYTANQMHAYARANMEPLLAENERLLGEWLKALGLSMQAQAEAKDLRGGCDVYQARAERLEKTLGAYQAAVNKIDDLIEYSLPMPPETKAALHAILADLTAALAQGGE